MQWGIWYHGLESNQHYISYLESAIRRYKLRSLPILATVAYIYNTPQWGIYNIRIPLLFAEKVYGLLLVSLNNMFIIYPYGVYVNPRSGGFYHLNLNWLRRTVSNRRPRV